MSDGEIAVGPDRLDLLGILGIPHLRAEDRRDLLPLVVEAGAIMVIFTGLSWFYWRYARLEEAAYAQPLVFLQALKSPRLLVTCFLPTLALLLGWRRIRWSEFEHAGPTRWFVFAVCLASAWTFSTYDYNLYLDQAHSLDRLLLLSCAVLTLWHPVFATFYVLFGGVLVHQFHYPLIAFTWLDKKILFTVLLLFTAVLYAGLFRRQRLAVYLGLAGSLLAANYFMPGLAKIKTSWLWVDSLVNLGVVSHANGWLGIVDTDRFLDLASRFAWINRPLIVVTLITEFGAIFFFTRRKLFAALVLATVALHIGIFLTSGICFWKWVLLNLGTLWTIWKLDGSAHRLLFSRNFWLISVAVVLTSPWHARPSWLVWYDTPYDEFFEVQAVGVSGQEYNVERGYFAPFDVIFAQNRFWYAVDSPTLVGTFGATSDIEVLRATETAKSTADIDTAVATLGTSRFDAERTETLRRFLRVFFATLNERGSKHWWLSRLASPHHIWSQRQEPVYQGEERIVEVSVHYHRVWFDRFRLRPLEDRQLMRIKVPGSRSFALEGAP